MSPTINDIGHDNDPTWDDHIIKQMIEELANIPREELGKRQPGETCMYERKRDENKEI